MVPPDHGFQMGAPPPNASLSSQSLPNPTNEQRETRHLPRCGERVPAQVRRTAAACAPSHTSGGRQGRREIWPCQWRSNLAKRSGSVLGEGGSPQSVRSGFGQREKTVHLGCLEGSAAVLESLVPHLFQSFCVCSLDGAPESALESEPSACLSRCCSPSNTLRQGSEESAWSLAEPPLWRGMLLDKV